jgi:hypothetical protein
MAVPVAFSRGTLSAGRHWLGQHISLAIEIIIDLQMKVETRGAVVH